MIVDTSAIMAIALGEPEGPLFIDIMARTSDIAMSVGTWVELSAVLTRRGNQVIEALAQDILRVGRIRLEPVSVIHGELAAAAYRRYGRGSRHPAALNFGDCFAYALAAATGEPLLFKGEDFARTDIRRAL